MDMVFLIGDLEQMTAWVQRYNELAEEERTHAADWALPFARQSVWRYTICEQGHIYCEVPEHKKHESQERAIPVFTDDGRAEAFLALLPASEGWRVIPFSILHLLEACNMHAGFCLNPKKLTDVACIKAEWIAKELIDAAYKHGFEEGRASAHGEDSTGT